MILITGGTGTSGKPIVQQLAASRATFRVLARNPDKARQELNLSAAQIVKGDFNDPGSLEAACRGVEQALLNSNPGPDLAEAQGRFIDAARKAGLRHIVKFSVHLAAPEARHAFGHLHGEVEKQLKASGMAWTMLQPTFFMQNMLGMAGSIKSGGAFYQPGGQGKAPYVDVRDIAAVATKALTEPGHEGKTYVITGPQDLSGDDMAGIISTVIAKPVKYVDVPRQAAKETMIKSGMSDWQAESVCELMDLLKQGAMSGVTNVVRDVGKKPPVTFEQFVREHAGAFRA